MKNRKKQYLRSLKLAKKFAAVAMLSATLAGASTSLVKLTSSTAYAAEQTGRRVEKIPFKTETKEDPTLPKGEKKVVQKGVEGEKEIVTTQDSTTVKSRKPADVVIILDGSTSMSGNYLKSLRAAQALVNSLSDEDRVIVAMYTANTSESYIAGNNGYQGGTTVALTKAQALDGINKLMAGNPSNARGDLNDFLGAFGGKIDPALQTEQIGTTALREPKSGTKTPMEELIQKQRRANTTLSIAQFTDGWETQETIDTSFVDYAKKNAKTFMSIVFPTGGNATDSNAFGSAAKMTAAGHPNVYKAVDDSKVANDVVKQFENTAIDVIKGEPKTTEKVIKQPVDEIIAIGTKAAEPKVTKRTPIPFKTIYEEDPTLEAGQKRTRVKGVEGFKEVITSTTPDVSAIAGKGNGVLNFTTKAPVSTNSENQIEPLTTVHVYDYSSSYAGKVKDSLRLSKKIIEANKNENSKHILQLYPDNYSQTSYHAWTKSKLEGTQGISSKLLTKKEALEVIDKLLKINAPSEKDATYQNYGQYFQGLADALGSHRYIDESSNDAVPFEDIVTKLVKPSDTVSVIQYTDGWMDSGKVEVMDKSFAEWAKKRAKTFMSVINRNQVTENDTNSMQSINQMRELGHPNIYDMTGKDMKTVDDEIIKQFLETATVKVTAKKGEDQTAKITIGGDGVKILTAKLKGAVTKDLTIKDGKVDVSEKLADGSYSVEFTAEGNGTVTAKVAVDGKDADTKTVALKETAGKKGTSTTDEKVTPAVDEVIQVGTKPVTKESATPFKTIYEEDKDLEAGKKVVKQEGSAGAGSVMITYTLNKQTGEVTPKETKSDKPAQDEIIKVGTKPKVVETKIPYETIEEKDPTLPEGERKVKTTGKEGLKTVTTTYTLNTENGEVTPKEEVKDEPKVDEVILVGTKKKAAQVKLRFLDQKSNKSLKDDEIVTNDKSKFGDEFSLKPEKELKVGKDLYRLVEIKLTDAKEDSKIEGLSEDKKSLTSKVTEAEQSYDAVYERVVYTSYVDENGKELDKTVEGAQDKKEIKGYDFVKTEKSDNGDVKHIYKAKPIKGKTPVKYAETNEKSGVMYSILGLIGAAALAESIRRKKQSK